MVAVALIPVVGELLTGLGVGLAAGKTAETVWRRHRSAEEAQYSPLAKADVGTRKRDKCQDCPPSSGVMAPVPHSMSQAARDYQAFITKFPNGKEWIYRGTDFDGFQELPCLLQEAKAYYTNFFNENTLKPEDWWIGRPGYMKLIRQATVQHEIVTQSLPARLKWYFLEKKMQLSMARIFIDLNLLRIETEWVTW